MAWPVDGRDRTVPPRSPDARTADEFQEELVDQIMRAALVMGTGFGFPEELDQAQGRVYHATYLQYFSFFAWRFPTWLMAVASQCPHQDVRRTIIGDCVDEEVGDPDAGGRCHVDVLYEEAEACGLSRDVISATEPTPIILACVHAFENFSRTLGWEGGFAAIASLEILQSEPGVRKRNELMAELLTPEQFERGMKSRESKHLSERTGVPAEDLIFAAVHAYKDQFHGGGELELLRRYGTSRDIQDRMIWAARAAVQVYCAMRIEIDRVCRAAVGLSPREGEIVSVG